MSLSAGGEGRIPEGPPGRSEGARAARLAAAALLAGCLATLPFLVHPWYTPYRDSAIYLSCAQSLADTGEYSFLERPFTLRPPGFSLLLALVLRLFGPDFLAMNAAVSLFGVAGVVALFLLAQPGLGTLPALLLAVAAWLNPLWQQLGTSLLSDIPGFAIALAALAFERRAARAPSRRKEVLLGILIGLASLVRSVNIFLLPAVLLSRLARLPRTGRPPWRAFVAASLFPVAAATLLVAAPWAARNALVREEGPSEQTMISSYGVAQWRRDRGDPDSPAIRLASLANRVRGNAWMLVTALGSRGTSGRKGLAITAAGAAVAALLSVGAAAALARRREPQDFFLAANVAILLVYFELNVRLFLPVLVLALTATAQMSLEGLRALGLRRAAVPLVSAALLALAIADFSPRRGWDILRQRHEETARWAAAVNALLPPGARIGAWMGTDWSPYLGRPVYSLAFLHRRAPEGQDIEHIIDRYRLDAILADAALPPAARRQLRARYAAAATRVPRSPLILYRVRPRPAARERPPRAR